MNLIDHHTIPTEVKKETKSLYDHLKKKILNRHMYWYKNNSVIYRIKKISIIYTSICIDTDNISVHIKPVAIKYGLGMVKNTQIMIYTQYQYNYQASYRPKYISEKDFVMKLLRKEYRHV